MTDELEPPQRCPVCDGEWHAEDCELGNEVARRLKAEAERDKLRAEVERLRPNALRYEFLRDDINSDWAICEWSHDEPDGIGYYRDARAPDVVDAAIDRAIESAKEQQ